MKKLILFLLIGSLLILPLSGCFADNKQNEGTTPNNTTENTTPEVTTPEVTTPEVTTHDKIYPDPPEPSYAMSAQAPTEWEIANGDIPISLSFGLKEGCSSNAESFSNIIFEFCNNEKQIYVFKKIDIAEIEKPEYIVEYVYDEGRQIVGFNYAHTEEVELPLSMFSADSGYITIAMIEWEDDGTEKGASGAGGGTILYYKRNGENTLIISDKPIPESTTPDNPPEVTTPEVTTPPENNQVDPPFSGDELDKNSDLIVALVTYLQELNMDILMPPVSFTTQIYKIKQGNQPLHVAFDANDYYFVCVYNNKKFNYDDSIWVKYDNETAIQEYYNGIKLAKAFQINRSLSVTDILPSDKPVPDMEHFSLYEPVFENGINIAGAEIFDRTFIYLNDSTDETIYYSIGKYNYKMVVIPCVYFENQYYLSFRHYVIYSDGRQSEKSSYESMFGDYCDILSSKAIAEKYSVTNDSGFTWFYVLVPLEDFVNGVLK